MDDAEAMTEARRALGGSLASFRRAAGLNQEQLAVRVGYRRSSVANIETGRQRAPRSFWERCEAELGAHGALVRGYEDLEALVREHHRARAAQEAMTNRRDVNKLAAMLPMVASGSMLVRPIRFARVDRRLIASHREIAETLATLYRGGEASAMLPMAIGYADSLLELLDSPMGDREHRELSSIAVGVHAQIGLWACHLYRTATAHRYLATACDLAASTRDATLHARALGAFSYLFSSAPRGGYGGRPARALALLNAALTRAEQADGFTRGWLATWRADQHATLGNLRATRSDIETAATGLMSGAAPENAGFFARGHYGYGMTEHLDSVRAVTLAVERNSDEADRTFAHVQKTAANMRRRIATYGHLGLAQVAAGQPEAACHALGTAAMLAVQERYPMGLIRVLGVRESFPARWRDEPEVRDLDDQLAVLGGS
ncbi:MAG: helix-turn-helix domain-containing protein [Micromonosporaceae bacterium]